MIHQTATRWLLLVVWLALVIATYTYVHLYGAPVPYADEWAMVEQAVGNRPITLDWLWSLHNEHRLPLTRLLYSALVRFTSNSIRAVMFFDVALLAASAMILMIALHKIRSKEAGNSKTPAGGAASISDIFIPLALLGFGHYENLVWANQIQFVLTAGSVCVILSLISMEPEPKFKTLLPLTVCLILLPLCGTAGVILQSALLVWLFYSIRLLRNNVLSKAEGTILVLLGIIAVLTSVFYFVGFRPEFPYRTFNVLYILRGTAEFLSTPFGPASTRIGPVISIIVSVLLFWSLYLVIRVWKNQPEERIRAAGLAALFLSYVLLTIVVAAGRSGGGPGAAGGHRYVTLTAPLLVAILFCFSLYNRHRAERWVPTTLTILALLAIPWNFDIAIRHAETRGIEYRQLQLDAAANLPAEALATRDGKAVFPFYTPELVRYIRLMQQYQMGPFAGRTNPLSLLPEAAEMELPLRKGNQRRNSVAFEFQDPKFLLGFRPTLIAESPGEERVHLYVTWLTENGLGSRRIWITSKSSDHEQTHTFWVYDTIRDIEIRCSNGNVRITRMTVLLPRTLTHLKPAPAGFSGL